MLDLLRSHPTTLAMGLLGWLTWQALTGVEGKVKAGGEPGELPVVTAEAVAQRPRGAPTTAVRNPFPALAMDGLFNRVVDESDGGGQSGDEEGPPEPVIVLERRPAFELRLDAIFAFGPEGGHARINGQDVRRGGTIDGCDPESPPVLVDFGGLSARIEHRGQEYDLHLDLMQRLSLGGEVIRHELPPGADPAGLPFDAAEQGTPTDATDATNADSEHDPSEATDVASQLAPTEPGAGAGHD